MYSSADSGGRKPPRHGQRLALPARHRSLPLNLANVIAALLPGIAEILAHHQAEGARRQRR